MDREPLKGMVNVNEKPITLRWARARGRLYLRPATVERVRRGEVEKGDPYEIARTAALLAVKSTHHIIPHCHPVPVGGVAVSFREAEDHIEVEVDVEAHYRTGVEMEALTGVAVALLTLWDVLKRYEKDERGQYPATSISEIEVIEKRKGGAYEQ